MGWQVFFLYSIAKEWDSNPESLDYEEKALLTELEQRLILSSLVWVRSGCNMTPLLVVETGYQQLAYFVCMYTNFVVSEAVTLHGGGTCTRRNVLQ